MPLEQEVLDMGHQLEKLVGEGKAVSCCSNFSRLQVSNH